jgi:hypothetical protein
VLSESQGTYHVLQTQRDTGYPVKEADPHAHFPLEPLHGFQAVDEVQDMQAEAIPVIEEAMSDSTFNRMWLRSFKVAIDVAVLIRFARSLYL